MKKKYVLVFLLLCNVLVSCSLMENKTSERNIASSGLKCDQGHGLEMSCDIFEYVWRQIQFIPRLVSCTAYDTYCHRIDLGVDGWNNGSINKERFIVSRALQCDLREKGDKILIETQSEILKVDEINGQRINAIGIAGRVSSCGNKKYNLSERLRDVLLNKLGNSIYDQNINLIVQAGGTRYEGFILIKIGNKTLGMKKLNTPIMYAHTFGLSAEIIQMIQIGEPVYIDLSNAMIDFVGIEIKNN